MGKVDPRSEILVCFKGVHDIILENSSAKDYSKTSDIVQTLEIMEMLEMHKPYRNHGSGDYGNAG